MLTGPTIVWLVTLNLELVTLLLPLAPGLVAKICNCTPLTWEDGVYQFMTNTCKAWHEDPIKRTGWLWPLFDYIYLL